MKHCVILTLVIAAMPICDPGAAAELSTITTLIQPEPLHAGRIDPKLFGNFIELLDDVVPGMWADMLNDRSFEGVTRAADWCYYDGSLDICDRQWEANPSWTYDSKDSF